MNDSTDTLSCVMIPMNGRQLLLPNVSIAEVVDFAGTEAPAGGPEWLAGKLEWRGLDLPIISYDAANGGAAIATAGSRGRIVVLNTIGDHHDRVPFMALVTQGIPSQTRLTEDQVKRLDGDTGSADLMQVDVDGETAYIPDLGFLESLAIEASQN
ncbi:chemotaxis protein CheW [Marinobacter confluentis]|uniref:Chemotaxis protein CheW n=1 Tax=Marinobacter confluentis TaxID=1697557 RepID=A0A4Z1BZI7_9GAMM|nr:chemotaxis protein CheW [Marinobacter confluentis]TGN38913.1 chemotaxis protein CheW [Marinobacter confluentis]